MRNASANFGGEEPSSFMFTFRVDEFPDESQDEWSAATPMTLLRMEGETTDGPVLFVRVRRRRVFVTYFVQDGNNNYEED